MKNESLGSSFDWGSAISAYKISGFMGEDNCKALTFTDGM